MQIGKAARSNGSHIKSRLKMEPHGVFKEVTKQCTNDHYHSRFHVFTFSRLENWVNVLRLSPPATDTQRSLRSERGTPRFRAHALPSDPCRTGGQLRKDARQTGRTGGIQAEKALPGWACLGRIHAGGRNVFGRGAD